MDDNSATVSAFDYLSALYQNCTTGDLVFTSGGNKVAAVFSCTQIEDAAAFIESYDACDLYLKVNLMDHEQTVARNPHGVGGTNEVAAIVSFHLDIDCNKSAKYPTRDEALQALDSMPMPPSIIIDTNGTDGGFHAYWLLDCPIMLDDEKTRQTASQASRNWLQLLRERLPGKTVDGTANIDRVLRPIGSMRLSGNRVSAHRFEPHMRYAFDAFTALIPKVVEPVQVVNRSDSESVIAKYLDGQNISVRSILHSQGYVEKSKGQWIRPGSESGEHTGKLHSVHGREGFTVYSGNAAPLSCDNSRGGTGNWYSREALWLSFEFNVDANGNPGIWQEASDTAKKELDQQAMEGVCLDQIVRSIDDSDDDDDTAIDDEAFARSMVPDAGLLRELHDAYWESSFRRCSIMGLAASLAIVQTLLGRKVFGWTRLATNDYHLILAPTASGKEGPLKFATELLSHCGMALPEKMQSGNGLISALRRMPSSLWSCDEFGYLLESVLDPKNRNPLDRQLATLLLSLYGKSSSVYMGSAYAAKLEEPIQYPNLSVLGVSTGATVWGNVTQRQIHDGLLGRICFWRVGERPETNRGRVAAIPEAIVERVRQWSQWTPGDGNLCEVNPHPIVMEPTKDARERWESHSEAIESRANSEPAMRTALWGRVASRSQKLAIVHRMARLSGPEEINEWNMPEVELEDVEWGIKIANWSARLACDLVGEMVADDSSLKLRKKILSVIRSKEPVSRHSLGRVLRSFSNAEVRGMLKQLEQEGAIRVEQRSSRGRPRDVYRIGTAF